MNNVKRIIFLDIDGVLAGYEYLCSSQEGPFRFIDPEKCKLVNQLKGAEIVISSSWGYDNGKTEETLKACGLEIPIIGYTDHFYQEWLCRGNEIEKWLKDNFGGMCTKYGYDDDDEPYYKHHYNKSDIDYEFVIFDDDADMLLGQKDNFIQTNEEFGLTQEDIDKAKKILDIK